MKPFYKAIYNQFTSTSTGGHKAIYTKVGGRLYSERAPSNAPYPHVVYSMVSQVHEWQFKSDYERMLIQFDLYSSTRSMQNIINQMSTMYDLLTDCYDDTVLNTSGYTSYNMIRNSVSGNVEFIFDTPNGETVWQKIVEYEVLLEKNT